jgi:hypothetical protein
MRISYGEKNSACEKVYVFPSRILCALLSSLMIPALSSCAAPVPEAHFDGMDGASTISGIVRIAAGESFTNYAFHTEVKRRERRCYGESRYSCQYEDVFRKVDIDIGGSSVQLFQGGLGRIFQQGLAPANGDAADAVEVVPSVSGSGSHDQKDDWWLYVVWNNWTLTCDANIQYSVLLRNQRGETEVIRSEWSTAQQEIHAFEAVVTGLFSIPFRLANLFDGRDAIATVCFSKAFAQAETKAFSNLAEKLYASPILRTLAAKQ